MVLAEDPATQAVIYSWETRSLLTWIHWRRNYSIWSQVTLDASTTINQDDDIHVFCLMGLRQRRIL